MQGFQEAN